MRLVSSAVMMSVLEFGSQMFRADVASPASAVTGAFGARLVTWLDMSLGASEDGQCREGGQGVAYCSVRYGAEEGGAESAIIPENTDHWTLGTVRL